MPTHEQIEQAFVTATGEILPSYFQLPIADLECPSYRERVYCYELYHQWRKLWPLDCAYSLSGEIDKAGHPLVRGGDKPDFLVHIPGEMNNLLIVEVKSAVGPKHKIADDLMKLCRFRRAPISYEHAIFLIYGIEIGEWPNICEEIISTNRDFSEFDPDLIHFYVHERPAASARQVRWLAP